MPVRARPGAGSPRHPPVPVVRAAGVAVPGGGYTRREKEAWMEFLLWLLAVILVVAGVVYLVRGAILHGIVLVVVGLLVGPGGVSVFT